METEFWHQKWASNEIAFHEGEANALLIRHFDTFSLLPGSRVFVPLCGKTRDIAWLLAKGCRIAGAELSAVAIDQLFAELGVQPTISSGDFMTCYHAPNIDIFVGDIFSLSRSALGSIDAIYDRAALVALPDAIRARYAKHLMEITGHAPQLIITYEYDQQQMPGPPFSVSNEELRQHYVAGYDVTLLASAPVTGGLKGKCPAQENIWLLQNRQYPRHSSPPINIP